MTGFKLSLAQAVVISYKFLLSLTGLVYLISGVANYHAQHTYAQNSTFNDVVGDQYTCNVYQTVQDRGLSKLSSDLWLILSFIAVSNGLLKLQPAPMDASNRTECLTSTRVDLLRSIERWADNLSCNQNVLWLHGLAGVGKSTLSTTLANRLLLAGQLGMLCFRLSTSTPS